jgi:ribonuclease III
MAFPIEKLQKKIDYTFKDDSLLLKALTHSSYAYECTQDITDNEVLEFLGDSVLGFIIADYLYRNFPQLNEGEMSKLKSTLASTGTLVIFAQRIRLNKHLRLGKGEMKSGGRNKKTILAGAFEALIAALFLDGGISTARRFLLEYLNIFFNKVDMSQFFINNYKSALQEHLQKENDASPVYQTVTTKGPDHKKRFLVKVSSQNQILAKARGISKKEAEQKAAQKAMKNLIGKKLKTLTEDTFLIRRNEDD